MPRPLRTVRPADVAAIDATIGYLRRALEFSSPTPRVALKIQSAIKSAQGAKRHAIGVMARAEERRQ